METMMNVCLFGLKFFRRWNKKTALRRYGCSSLRIIQLQEIALITQT
jgi:hypothetical protein